VFARISRAPEYPQGVLADALRAFWEQMRDNWGDPGSIEMWAPSLADDPEYVMVVPDAAQEGMAAFLQKRLPVCTPTRS